MDDKVLAQFSMQLRNSSKYQLAVSRLFAKYRDEQLENVKDNHTAVVGEKKEKKEVIWYFIIHYICKFDWFCKGRVLILVDEIPCYRNDHYYYYYHYYYY